MKKGTRRRFRNACQGKLRYDTLQQAKAAAWNISKKKQETLRAYHCAFCKFWHVGHRDKFVL